MIDQRTASLTNHKWAFGPEFIALGKKMKSFVQGRSRRQSFTPASSSFPCPAWALGLALQHHPILPAGKIIMHQNCIMKYFIKNETIHLISMYVSLYYPHILILLNDSPATGDHLKQWQKLPVNMTSTQIRFLLGKSSYLMNCLTFLRTGVQKSHGERISRSERTSSTDS